MLIPLVTKKGGLSHRRAGWVFVSGMTVVSITALLLAGTQVGGPIRRRAAARPERFLFFVSILTATNVSSGVRVLRAKARTTSSRHPWDLGLPALLTASSIAAAAHGLSTGNQLFAAFSVIGLLRRWRNLAYWLTPPTHPMHWWFEHMSSMLGACVAATTAFAVVNASNLGLRDVLAARVAGSVSHWRANDRNLDSLLQAEILARRSRDEKHRSRERLTTPNSQRPISKMPPFLGSWELKVGSRELGVDRLCCSWLLAPQHGLRIEPRRTARREV